MERDKNISVTNKFTFLVLIIYGGLLLIGVHNHELWRDELQIWLIGTHSANISEFWSNRSLESDTFLWHFIVFIFTRFTDDIYSLQLFNIGISIASTYFILTKSPFTLAQKVLLIFGYYMLFEFALITRSYSLGFCFLILSLNFYAAKKHLSMAIYLFLLANTHLLMAILTFSFLIFYFSSKTIKTRYIIIVFIGVLLSVLDVFWQTYMNWDFELSTQYQTNFFWLFWYKISLVFKSFLILPDFGNSSWWNTNMLEGYFNVDYVNILMGLLSIGIFVVIYGVFKFNKFILLSISIGTGLLLILFGFFWGGSQRHWSHFFILLLAFYWLMKSMNLNEGNKFIDMLFTFILALQCMSGITGYTKEIKQKFSNSKQVAMCINDKANKEIMIAGYPDFTMTPISYHMGKDFYSFQSRKMESFIDWNRRENVDANEIINQVKSWNNDGQSLYVVLSSTYDSVLVNEVITSNEINILSKNKFSQGIEIYENYIVLEIGINKKTLLQ